MRSQEPGAKNHHLAEEQAEGRRPGDEQRREQQERARDGRPAERALPDHREVGRAVELRQRACGEERDRLGERVIGHVQQRPENRRLPAETDPDSHDPDVLDAGVRQQPLEIPLDQDEGHRDEHRQQAKREQEAAGEVGT